MFQQIGDLIKNWLLKTGLSEEISEVITDYSGLLIVLFFAWISYYIAKRLIIKFTHILVKKSKTNWDDILHENKVFKRLAYFAPAIIIYFSTPYVIPDYTFTKNVINLILNIYMVVMAIVLISAFLNAVQAIYANYEISKTRPIKGYIQVFKIIIIIVGSIIVISSLLGKSPTTLLLSLGTLSAVLMLVFKDPILGFVGGIQLTANNMVKIGDWISMPKHGADGTVTDISLTTVKVQNWDKTITTIPTYTLVTDYFQNWRGMEESGGRRIMRSINIDMTSVEFCTAEMLEDFRRIQTIKAYIEKRDKEIDSYNKKHNIDNSVLVNGRRQTNLGIFRAYLKEYLKNKNEIHTAMTFLVRQLQPTENGIPMQIYVFSRIQEWAKYEDVQSDIFDHILAVIPHFKLRVFQNPSGADFRSLGKAMAKSNEKT